ncbi:hypothetical protein NE237_011648 [Protea cynaroides]|uniref:Uncharacterized protein n=1 Tax=Protea cynaroides TaxID=273540 RepID=A0A9Q0GYL3_9MAGN|nr:hypothetical protein NE237_011648 [Protea cynaroides]
MIELEMASVRVGRGWLGIGGESTKTTIVAFTIPARPRPYWWNILKTKPRNTLLTQQLRSCTARGAIISSSAGKQRGWSRNQNQHRNRGEAQEETVEDIGGVGQAVLAALKSGVPKPNDSRISGGTDERRSQGGGERRTETPLSGSDVLLALQRAAAAEVGSGRGKGTGKRRRNGRGEGVHLVEDTMDYSDVRPLNVNRDWGFRLDDLERRLQDLLQL